MSLLRSIANLKRCFKKWKIDIGFDGDEFDCNLKMIFESVQRHVQEAEEEMFPKARELLDAAS